MILSTMSNIHQTYRHTQKEYAYAVEDAIKLIRDGGFEAVDISLISVTAHDNIMGTDMWPDFVAACQDALDRERIKPYQAHAYFSQDRTVTYGTPAFIRDMNLTKRTLQAAGMLGIPWVVVHPLHGHCMQNYSQDEVFSLNKSYFLELAETASKAGVGIAIENMIQPHYNQPQTLLNLLDVLDADEMFGICLDTGHANVSGLSLPEVIRMFGSKLKATHIHDNRGRYDEHLLPYLGNIEWEHVMTAFHDIGYAGAFNYEVPEMTRNLPSILHGDIIQYAFKLGNYLLNLAK